MEKAKLTKKVAPTSYEVEMIGRYYRKKLQTSPQD